jgi:hypothetical protein
VREEVERLKHDADVPTDSVDVDPRGRDLLALDDDPAALDRFQEVDATKHRRLPRARSPD